MDRSGSTSLLDGPSDEEMDDFLDGSGFAADRAARDESATSEEPDEASQELAEEDADEDTEAADEEEDEDAESDEDAADEEPDDDPSDLRQRLEALEAEREQERQHVTAAIQEVHAERQRTQTAGLLLEMRARMTEHEWAAFTDQLSEGFKDQQIAQLQGQLQQRQQQDEYAAYEAAESEAIGSIMSHVRGELGGLSPVEELALTNCADPMQFKTTLHGIVEARKGMTEPARRALRERRQANGADRGGPRGSGGARPASKSYGNFNPDNFDAYLDDLGAPR